MRKKIAISIGDIGGIGPEIILKGFSGSNLFALCTPVVFCPESLLAAEAQLVNPDISIHRIAGSQDILEGAINVVPIAGSVPDRVHGVPTAEAGAMSLKSIETAVDWCTTGICSALVTSPISKESIGLAGSKYRGHTEYLRDLTSSEEVLMVLASSSMKVGLVTIHIPLSDVAESVSMEKIVQTVQLAGSALVRDFGIREPRLAVLGLNPHAGDGGYIGSEERTIITPAIEQLRNNGLTVSGPYPADAYFSGYGSGRHDMVIAMYHDQGLIPLKMSAEGRAVNISCGLPIVRTSPDHGTAFDIAGKGVADPGSFIEAVEYAIRISSQRRIFSEEMKHD